MNDGFFEARLPAGDFFGRERALEVVRANRNKPASEIIETLHGTVLEQTGQETLGDDLTAMVIKVQL